MKSKVMEKNKQLTSTIFFNVKQSKTKQYQDLLQDFSPNPGTYLMHNYGKLETFPFR